MILLSLLLKNVAGHEYSPSDLLFIALRDPTNRRTEQPTRWGIGHLVSYKPTHFRLDICRFVCFSV